MPVYYNRLETIPTSPITGAINGSVSTFQQRLIHLLFFVRKSSIEDPLPFLVPIILSVHIYPQVSCYSPVSLNVPITQYGRSQVQFLLNHTDYALTHPYISAWSSYRTVHSQIRQLARQGKHSNHKYFIESRLIGSTSHLWDDFVELVAVPYGYSQPLSWSFTPRPLQSTHVHQDQAFQGVTPSFHLSNYQFINL